MPDNTPVAPAVAPAVADPKAVAPADPKAVAPVEPKEETYKVTHNGQTIELTAKDIISLQEKAKQFDLTAKEKAELSKGLAAILTHIDNNPLELYKMRGKDPKKLITEQFKKLIEEDMLDPQQRELAELKAFKESKLKEQEDAKKAQEAEAKAQEKKALYVKILKEIDVVLTEKGLPKDQYTIDRLLRIMAAGKRVRGQTFTVAEAADIVAKEELRHLGFIAKQLPSERLKELFGPDIIKKLNQEQVQKLKEADVVVKKENQQAAAATTKTTADDKKKYRREFNGI